MTTLSLKHEINSDEATFWRTFIARDYNEQLYRGALGFPEFEIREENDSQEEYTRTTYGIPKMSMPGPIQKLLGASFSYTEHGRLDRAKGLWTFKITPSTLADKMRYEGTVRLEKIGDTKVRRLVDIVIEAKVFGLGGLLETTAEKSMREGWENSAVFMNEWVKKLG
jgi:hypothetical protein